MRVPDLELTVGLHGARGGELPIGAAIDIAQVRVYRHRHLAAESKGRMNVGLGSKP